MKAGLFAAAVLLLSALLVSAPVGAATAHGTAAWTGGDDVEVAVPQTQLDRREGAEVLSVQSDSLLTRARFGEGARLDFGASTWVPGSLQAESARLHDASAFGGSGLPQATLTFVSPPLARWRQVTVAVLAGAGFARLDRSGTYLGDEATPARTIRENLYLIPVRLGAEGQLELSGPWRIYGSAALMPSVGFTTRTVFDDGQTVGGVPLQFTAGVSNELRWLSASLRGIQLQAGVEATTRTFGAADFSGVGAAAGMSFPL